MLKQIPLPNSNLSVSQIALGAMLWGTAIDIPTAESLYDAYRQHAGNTFDTAHIYAAWQKDGLGLSEKTLGQIIHRRNDRKNIVLITKGGHPPTSFYPHPDRYLAPETIKNDIKESLQRLNFPSVDLYMLHRDDRRVPVAEIIAVLNEESAAGRIANFGVSNWRPARIQEANDFAKKNNAKPFIASQPQFSLALPNTPESDLDTAGRFLSTADVAWHESTQFPAFCYSPTAHGYFASNGQRAAASYDNPTSKTRLHRANQLAKQLALTPNQIALAWILTQKFPALPLLGTSNLPHLQDALTTPTLPHSQLRQLTN